MPPTPLVPSLTSCKTFVHVAPGSASAAWRCSLDLPNSFSPDDGQRLQARGYGATRDQSSEDACRRAMALLLLTRASDVVLQDAHWWISPESLLGGLPGTIEVHQALPEHVPPPSRESGVDAAGMTAAEVNDRVAALLRRCLTAFDGSFDPAHISLKNLSARSWEYGLEPVYSQLNRLLKRVELRTFVDNHPEFSWSIGPLGPLTAVPKGIPIMWAVEPTPLAPSSASAQQTLLALHAHAPNSCADVVEPYKGRRRWRQRFKYKDDSRSALVELFPPLRWDEMN